MILWRLLNVALGHSRRRLALTCVTAITAGLVAGGVVYLVNDAAFRSEELVRSLGTPAARSITLRAKDDASDRLLPSVAVQSLAQLDGVERAVAFSKVRSATVAGFDDAKVSVGFLSVVALRGGDPFRLVSGQEPNEGEVIASESAASQLRLTHSVGAVRVGRDELPLVGIYDPSNLGGITQLIDGAVITPSTPEADGYFSLVMIARQPSDVAVVVESSRLLLADLGPANFTIDFDQSASSVEALVAKAGNSNVRSTALGIVVVGAFIEMVIAFLNALLQRREIARRRALGYTRGQVLGALMLEGTFISCVGSLVGVASAAIILVATGETVLVGQMLSTAAFVTLIGAAATLPGGALGAYQDPAQILRVP